MLSQLNKYFRCYDTDEVTDLPIVQMMRDEDQIDFDKSHTGFVQIDVLKLFGLRRMDAYEMWYSYSFAKGPNDQAERDFFEKRWSDRIVHIIPNGILERDFCRNEVNYFSNPHLEPGYLTYQPNENYGTRRRVRMFERGGRPRELISDDPYENFILAANLPNTLFTYVPNVQLMPALLKGYEVNGGVPIFASYKEADQRASRNDSICQFDIDDQDIRNHLHGQTLTGSGTGTRVFHAYYNGVLKNLTVA